MHVDTLGFLGDIGMPMFDDRTKKNAVESGIRLFVMTTSWPMQDWQTSLQMHQQVKAAFDARGIEMPFPHRTLYTGSETAPLPVRVVGGTEPAGSRPTGGRPPARGGAPTDDDSASPA